MLNNCFITNIAKNQLINLAVMKNSHDYLISCLIANDVDITCIIDVGYCLIIQNKYVVRQEFIHITDLGCTGLQQLYQWSIIRRSRVHQTQQSPSTLKDSRLQTELIKEPVLIRMRGFCRWLNWFCLMSNRN